MSLAYNVACYNSLFKYKNIDHWREWFDKDHIAIISPERIRELFKKATEPKHVYIFDDISVSYSNRSWQSKTNKFLNSLFITSRIYNNCIIMSLPTEGMVDIQARSLFTHYCEITGPHLFNNIEVNFGKVFHTALKPRQKHNPVYYYYPRTVNTTYDMMSILAPPKEITDWYDRVREEEVDKLADADNGSQPKDDPEKSKPKVADLKPLILEYLEENPPPTTKKELIAYRLDASKKLNCTNNYLYKIMKGCY